MRPVPSNIINKLCHFAPVIALSCSLAIVFAAHSVFSFGVWRKAEPVVVAFHGTSALCALALLLVWWRSRATFQDSVMHPVVLLPFAVALWSTLAAPISDFPLLSLMGSPQIGEGALWYANFSVLIACALVVVREKAHWRFLMAWSIAILAGLIIVRLNAALQGGYELIWIGAYLAYIGMAAPLICLRHLDGKWRWFWLVMTIAGIVVLVLAQSKAALVLFLAGAAAIGLGWVFKDETALGKLLRARPTAVTAVGLAAIAPAVVIALGLLNDVASLYSRFLVFKLMGEALQFDWHALLFGQGWGRTQDALIANLNASAESLVNLRWDYFSGDYLHTHHWAVESLYAAGLPGLILVFLFYLSIPTFCDPKLRVYAFAFAAAYAGLNGLWFQVSFSLPFIAIALAALCGDCKRVIHSSVALRVAPVMIIMIATAQIFSVSALYSFGQQATKTAAAYQDPTSVASKIQFPTDIKGAEHGFALSIRDHLAWLKQAEESRRQKSKNHQQRVVRSMIRDLEQRIEKTPSPYIALAGIALFSDLVFDPQLKWLEYKLQKEDQALWGRWVRHMLSLAPGRTDTAIPYFSWLLTRQDLRRLESLTLDILKKRPRDPVALYFRGAVWVKDANLKKKKQGLKSLRESIRRGIERFMPIDPTFKRQLMGDK